MVIAYGLRVAGLLLHGVFFTSVWIFCMLFVWVSMQFEVNEILHLGPLVAGTIVIFGTKVVIDFLNDIIDLWIAAME